MKVEPPTFWSTVTARPLAVLCTSWPWRALLYLTTSLPVAVLWSLLCWPLLLLAGLPLGALERRRLTLLEPGPAPTPHLPFPGRTGSPAWVRVRLREVATWRELAYGLMLLPLSVLEAVMVVLLVSLPLALLASPVLHLFENTGPEEPAGQLGSRILPALPWAADLVAGLVLLVVSAYLTMVLAAGRARLTALVLTGDRQEELGARLGETVRSRARLADAFTAERRRIERDLHDGAQQRLTSVIMRLGMARNLFDSDPDGGRALVDQAYRDAKTTLTELRDLVHGIHPATLTERGLAAALEEMADTCPVPLTVRVNHTRRPPEPIESTVYFCAAEAVANAVRHSGADRIDLSLGRSEPDRLLLRVSDDGVGGADPGAGSGLTGLADRAEALGGRVHLNSPPGGPTTVEVEIPCGS